MIYRDQVTRMSLRQLRAQYAPRNFQQLDKVTLECGGASVAVKILRLVHPTVKGGTRRWFSCPSCQGKTTVLGLVKDVKTGEPRWGCARRTCGGGWHSRKILKTTETPHLQPAGDSP